MTTLRRLSYAALGVAFTHLVFGAIVRISGSGMGCGDNWPKCYGHWFPPFDRPDLIIEWTHRLLASLLILTILALATATVLRRREAGVSGRGGILRPVLAAVLVVLVTAGFGAVTVFLGNPTWATVVHWTLAMTLLAVLAAAAIRAGALGGATIRSSAASAKTARSAYLAAGMAFLTVVMGGLTAKFPFGSVACQSFPDCGRHPGASDAAVHVQLTHRTIAILLVLYLIGMAFAVRRRSDARAVRRATFVAATLGLAQIAIAAAMVLLHLPAQLRSLHEAVGVGIWLSTFTLAYLAHLAGRTAPEGGAERAELVPRAPTPAGEPLPATANLHASTRSALARGAEPAPGHGAAGPAMSGEPAGAFAGEPDDSAPSASAAYGARPQHDVIGAPFPTAVVGEVELIDDEDPDASINADAVGTAALIAAVARADADSLRATPPTGTDELSLVSEALAALGGEPATADAEGEPGDVGTREEPAYATEPAAISEEAAALIEEAAQATADDIAAVLEVMNAAMAEEPVEATPVQEAAAPIAVAPDDALSVAAEVNAEAETPEASENESAEPPQRPHTMAVIVARGADL